MPDISWVKLSTGTFDDEKMLIIDSMPECDAVELIFIKLICQAGKCNADGWVYLAEGQPFTEEQLAAVLRRQLNTVRLALGVLQKLGLIEVSDAGIFLPGFGKHNDLDALEKIRESTRARVQKFRSNKASNVTTAKCNVTVTQQIREDKNKNREDKNILTGGPAPLESCHTLADYRALIDSENPTALLVSAFTLWHAGAPQSDFKDAYGRIGKIWATNNRDTGYVLKKIWDTASENIAGSHLNYLHKALCSKTAGRRNTNSGSKDPDKYIKGRYGHTVCQGYYSEQCESCPREKCSIREAHEKGK